VAAHHPVQLPLPDLSDLARDHAHPDAPDYVWTFGVNDSSTAPDILLTALVHGNEISGALVLAELARHWQRSAWQPPWGTVTLAFANVAALAAFNADRPDDSRFVDEDFNRVWGPSLNDRNRTSAERQRAHQLQPLVERATHLLDLHSMHEPGAPLWVTGLLPRNQVFAVSLKTSYQIVQDAGHEDGVRLRDHGDFSDPHSSKIALLLEAGQHWGRQTQVVTQNAVVRFLSAVWPPVVTQLPADWLLPDEEAPAAFRITHKVVAGSMDFRFATDFDNLQCIALAGTTIAWDGAREITTPYADCILVMPSVRQLRVGVTTVRLGYRAADSV
jgi:succinylglutamate desuccinylase